MLNASQITWPGVDKQRTEAAAWHLRRAAECLVAARDYPQRRWFVLKMAAEHARIGRGFLGAIGFEHHAGLWR